MAEEWGVADEWRKGGGRVAEEWGVADEWRKNDGRVAEEWLKSVGRLTSGG